MSEKLFFCSDSLVCGSSCVGPWQSRCLAHRLSACLSFDRSRSRGGADNGADVVVLAVGEGGYQGWGCGELGADMRGAPTGFAATAFALQWILQLINR